MRTRSRLALLAAVLPLTALAQIKYQYNKDGRLTKVDYGNGKSISYTYDASGNLTKRESVTVNADVTTVSSADFKLGPVAPEQAVSAFGAGFSTNAEGWTGLPVPFELAGTRVEVTDSQGTTRPAGLFYVSPGFLNYLIPAGTAFGPGTVRIIPSNGLAVEGAIEIQRISPGIFAANSTGTGAPAAYYVRVLPNGEQPYDFVFDNTLAPKPFSLGAEDDRVILVMFGTGFRGHQGNVTATLGGEPVPVQAAVAQGLPGLDQINIGPLPRSLAGRGEVNIVLTFDGKTANVTKVVIQ